MQLNVKTTDSLPPLPLTFEFFNHESSREMFLICGTAQDTSDNGLQTLHTESRYRKIYSDIPSDCRLSFDCWGSQGRTHRDAYMTVIFVCFTQETTVLNFSLDTTVPSAWCISWECYLVTYRPHWLPTKHSAHKESSRSRLTLLSKYQKRRLIIHNVYFAQYTTPHLMCVIGRR